MSPQRARLIVVISNHGSIVRDALITNDQARVQVFRLLVGRTLHGWFHIRLRRQARQEQAPRARSVRVRAEMGSGISLVPFKANDENHRSEILSDWHKHVFIATCAPL